MDKSPDITLEPFDSTPERSLDATCKTRALNFENPVIIFENGSIQIVII